MGDITGEKACHGLCVLQLCVSVWSSHVFLLVIVLPQGISLTATSFVFICAALLNTGTKFGSHPTPCLLFVNNFYTGLEKRKKIWHGTKAIQTKEQSDDRGDEYGMKWMVIGWKVKAEVLKLISIKWIKSRALYLNSRSLGCGIKQVRHLYRKT